MIRRRFYQRVSVLLGTALSVTGCDRPINTPDYGAPVVEYGTPQAHFEIDGTVVDNETQDPIVGIEVTFEEETAITDDQGKWSISADVFPCDPDCSVTAVDVDGEENGEYEEAVQEFSPSETAEGDGEWDEGTWEAKNIVIAMEASCDDSDTGEDCG